MQEAQITKVILNKKGAITSVKLNGKYGITADHSHYVFSRLPNLFESGGMMVFGNDGFFADGAVQFPSDGAKQTILKNLENQIVSALNRGVANRWTPSTPSVDGSTTTYWATENNWYPAGQPQNLFSLFMRTGQVTSSTDTEPIFIRPNTPAACARGTIMGMAYGFGYDESYDVPGLSKQPRIPSKFDPTPAGTTTMTITLGPWKLMKSKHR
ncbi:MAG: hypothetical protein P4L55_03845 [Syntrophobacteraceae bacterium]|nr:hypothetical protein [Syntrophobacteraceae bacterium]